MTAPRGPGGPNGGPPGNSNGGVPSAVRGAVLVGLAVIVGIIGLQIIDDSGPGSGSGGATIDTIAGATTTTLGTTVTTTATTGATATTAPTSTKAPTSTTALKLKPNGQVTVKVFNASGVPGVAQAMTDRLKAAGYNTLAPANLDKTRKGSVVQCRSGFANEGKVIVFTQVKTADATYERFPSDPPDGSDDADCIVIIGKAA